MFKCHLKFWWTFPTLVILLTASKPQQSIPPTKTPPHTLETNIPNPASAYCEEQGGRVDIRKGEAGQLFQLIKTRILCQPQQLFHFIHLEAQRLAQGHNFIPSAGMSDLSLHLAVKRFAGQIGQGLNLIARSQNEPDPSGEWHTPVLPPTA